MCLFLRNLSLSLVFLYVYYDTDLWVSFCLSVLFAYLLELWTQD